MKTFLLLASVSTALGCNVPVDEGSVAVREAIVGAVPDTAHPSVVSLTTDAGFPYQCTGTLIAPTLVLTAAHCANAIASDSCGARWDTYFDTPRAKDVVVRIGQRGETVAARGAAWKFPERDGHCGDDIAVLVLATAVKTSAPMPVDLVRGPRRLDALVAVGYGRREGGAFGERRERRDLHVVALGTSTKNEGALPYLESLHEFAVSAGPCTGDSGGPLLSKTTGKVVGVLSRARRTADVKDDCATDENVAVSTAAWAPFLTGLLDAAK